MGSTAEHQALVKEILVALGALGIPAWPRVAGSGWTPRGNFVSFSVPGEADITGIVPPEGWRLEIECKTGGAKLTKEQRAFSAMILRSGGIYIAAWEAEEMLRVLSFQMEQKRELIRRVT